MRKSEVVANKILELTLYMKPSCHLCHNAAALLRTLQSEYSFTIREVDITQDTAAYEKYWEYIPVVEAGGKGLLAAPFGEAGARKALDQLAREGLFG